MTKGQKALIPSRKIRKEIHKEGEITVDIGLLLKVAGIGMLVSVLCQVLSKSGKDDQSSFVSLAGIVLILLLLLGEIGALIEEVRSVFFL